MSLTKEMIMQVESEVESYSDESLILYHNTYRELNRKYPNSYYSFRIEKSFEEIVQRGLEDECLQ